MSIQSDLLATATSQREPSNSQPILHRQLSEVVTSRIRDSINSGEYAPGARLIEGRIAEELNVSRVPVREALRALAAEGLVEVRPRHGAIVASLDPASAREMVQIRATLEGLNARLAAEHCTPELAGKVAAVLAEGNANLASGDTAKLFDLNARFHDLLYAAGANTMLAELMRTMRDRSRRLFLSATEDEIKLTWEEHAAILRAVQAGDAALAALLAERHVLRAAQHYLGTVSK